MEWTLPAGKKQEHKLYTCAWMYSEGFWIWIGYHPNFLCSDHEKAQNSKWRPKGWFGHIIFFYWRELKNSFFHHGVFISWQLEKIISFLQGSPNWLVLGQNGSFLGQIIEKIKICHLFKTCFSLVRLQNIIDIQRKKLITKISKNGFQKLLFLTKKKSFSEKISLKSTLIDLWTWIWA